MNETPSLNDLWKAWKSVPSDRKLTALLRGAQPVLSAAASSYAGGKRDPVLKLEASRLAVHAFQTYDPDRGAKLETHLMHQLAPLRQAVHSRAQELKIPRTAWADLQNLREAERRLKEYDGMEPSALELADKTGLSLRRIGHLRQFGRAGIPASALADREPGQLFKFPAAEESWWADAVYVGLSPIEQKIYDWRTGMHGAKKLPTKEIASRLDLSSARVSQIVGKISDELQKIVA